MDHYQTDHNDHGASDPAGERGSDAPSRRTRSSKPAYVTLLENRHLRRVVAGQLGIRADQLRDGPGPSGPRNAEQEAADATAELLDDLIDALRAV